MQWGSGNFAQRCNFNWKFPVFSNRHWQQQLQVFTMETLLTLVLDKDMTLIVMGATNLFHKIGFGRHESFQIWLIIDLLEPEHSNLYRTTLLKVFSWIPLKFNKRIRGGSMTKVRASSICFKDTSQTGLKTLHSMGYSLTVKNALAYQSKMQLADAKV